MKIGYGLVAALAAACGAVVVAPMQAQGSKPPKAVKPAPTPAKAAADPLMSEVVGTLDDKKFTYGEVLAQAQKGQNAGNFGQAVAQLIGLDATVSLFGPEPKSSYTVTKARLYALLREKDPPVLGTTLDTMLKLEAAEREVKKDGIQVTPAQVDARIAQFMKMLRDRGTIPAGVTDAEFLKQHNMTREAVRGEFQIQTKLSNLLQQEFIEKRLGHKLTADDFFQARHIVILVPKAAPGQSPEDVKKADDAALAKITQIAADIESKKKTFEQAAKESGEDGSKDRGGKLGVQMRTVFDHDFEVAVYKLKTGEVSKPVRSQFGYHLILLEARGAEIPEAERLQYLDSFESGQMEVFLRDLVATKYKTTNKLARPQPQMPFNIPGAQGQ